MIQHYARFACIVSASKADLTQLLGDLRVPPNRPSSQAAALILGHEWTVTPMNPRLKPSYLERLKLRPDEMRELSVLP